MANRFQKMLFNLSTVSPLAFFMAIVWWLQCGAREITTTTGEIHLSAKSLIISIVGILGLLYAFRSILIVRIANKKLETVPIGVNSVKSKELPNYSNYFLCVAIFESCARRLQYMAFTINHSHCNDFSRLEQYRLAKSHSDALEVPFL